MINTGTSQIFLPAKFHNSTISGLFSIHKNKRVQFFMKHGVHLVGYNSVADSTGLSSFVLPLLPRKSVKSRKIPTKFELIAVQGHPRSSTLVPIESAHATSY